MSGLKQVICIKWGDLYGPEYVNRLYAMVRYNTSGPLRFVCLTEIRDGIRPEVECFDCPVVDLPLPERDLGWRKLSMFADSETLFGLEGDWLYLDLDVMVTGNLDEFFSYKSEKSFIVMQNWTQAGKGIGNTSVYRFRVGADRYLLDNVIANKREILSAFINEQTYVSRNVKELNFWPNEWCILFKIHCVPPWPTRFWREPVLPATARVVAFPGVPNPHDAVVGQWPAKRSHKKLYKQIRPTTWIQTIWDQAEQGINRK